MSSQKYQKMKSLLEEEETFPLSYTFKFIVPAIEVPQLINFLGEGFEIRKKPSQKGKYISVSAKKTMSSADEIIDIYKKMEGIKGVIAL